MTNRSSLESEDLVAYFTDVEELQEWFREALAASTLTKRLLVIHGVGGVGKSSLMGMFRLHCKSVRLPVAYASGDEAKSALAILSDWADDLQADDVALPTFARSLRHYGKIQARAEGKAQEAPKKAGEWAGRVAETAASAVIGAAIGSAVPGLGTLAGALGGLSAEALIDWLRSQGFAKPDIDLLLDPTERLTRDFLVDLAKTASKRRLVVMLDTFEQLTVLDDWACDLAQRMPQNVLLVIAGRAIPNWKRAWSSWLAQAHVEELQPMDDDTMRALVQRYYATVRGGEPDAKQTEAIIRFARGLPMGVTGAVQLWVEYGVEDLEAVKPEVVADLVDRLIEGVPSQMVPALEAAAAVRWFDQPILRAVTGQVDVRQVFNELRRFPFVRSCVEGFMLHGTVREILDESVRVQDRERHYELHTRAAAYFEEWMARRTSADTQRLGLEHLYHRVRADEGVGMQLFQETAEDLVRSRLINRLRTLLNDVNTYSLRSENSRLWRDYYNARLTQMGSLLLADVETVYEAISESRHAEPKLRAYALCDWGCSLAGWERLRQPRGVANALGPLEHGSRMLPEKDPKLNDVIARLHDVYIFKGEWERGIELLEQRLQFSEKIGDNYGVAYTLCWLKNAYGLMGNWRMMFDVTARGIETFGSISGNPYLRYRLLGWLGPWFPVWAGRCAETEQVLRDALHSAEQEGDRDLRAGSSRDLGMVLGWQGRYPEAFSAFADSVQRYEELGGEFAQARGVRLGIEGYLLIRQGNLEEAEARLLQSLSVKRELHDQLGFPELLNWLGELHEVRARQDIDEARDVDLSCAESYYRQSLDLRRLGRRHFECGALAGLLRVKHAQGDYSALPLLLAEAEQLAEKCEYNDHLASLRLTQGHIAWDGHIPEWGTGFGAALTQYQHALTHALRYNRLLLDEVLSGGGVGTPLYPVITRCQERGDEGRRMLAALRDWWQTDVNDVGAPRPDTISPIPEGIPLLEAERIARKREPGDGSSQVNLVCRIAQVLAQTAS